MNIPILGQSGNTIFGRTFFNVRLRELIEKAGNPENTRVEILLTDGARLGLCHIEELGSEYMTVRCYGEVEGCDLSLHLIPYHLIYRMEIDPTGGAEPRMGFQSGPPAEE